MAVRAALVPDFEVEDNNETEAASVLKAKLGQNTVLAQDAAAGDSACDLALPRAVIDPFGDPVDAPACGGVCARLYFCSGEGQVLASPLLSSGDCLGGGSGEPGAPVEGGGEGGGAGAAAGRRLLQALQGQELPRGVLAFAI